MSTSYYSAAQLEAAKKEELRQNLLKRIEATRCHLQNMTSSMNTGANFLQSSVLTAEGIDKGASGVQNTAASAAAFIKSKEDVRVMDFSAITTAVAADLQHTPADQAHTEALRGSYRALCAMLDTQEEPLLADELERAVPRMTEILHKREEDRYIIEVLEKSMEAVGFHLQESCSLERKPGKLYTCDHASQCNVFMARDGNGFLYETVVKSGSVIRDRKEQIVEDALEICDLYPLVSEEAAKRGVFLHRVDADFVPIEQMTPEDSLESIREKRRQRQKLQEKKMEE